MPPCARDRVEPTTASPLIAGGATLAGGAGTARPITAVAADVALLEPPSFVAVTTASSTEPASLSVRVYDVPLTSAIAEHADPSARHRCHTTASAACGSLHVPVLTDSVDPTSGSPTIAGRTELAGPPNVTGAVGLDDALPEPAAFDAVTVTRSVLPRSSSPMR